MKKILLICCAALCLILSACGLMGGRHQAAVTPVPTPAETKRPATATDLVPETASPTDISEPVSPAENGDVPSPEVFRPWIGDEKELKEIPFRYVFRGFCLTSAEKLSAIISGPNKSVIIRDEEGWYDYQSKYCGGIEWDAEFTFPDQYLFAEISMGAKPKYVGAYAGEKLMVGSEGLYVVANYDYNEIPISERIYAYSQNSSDIGAQYFVYIVAVDSSDIPEAVAENMKYVY